MTTRTKLSVRKDTIFKKPSNKGRESTFLKKAFELSELCGVDVCIICFDREGNLVKTWPKDEAKVRAMAERFSRLSVQERNKKNTNLSRFFNKKMMDEMKASLKDNDNRFSHKLLTIEDSLKSRLHMLQENLQRPLHQPYDQDQTVVISSDLSSNDSSSLINVDHPSTTESPADLATTSSSSLNHPSKFSILLYNHDSVTFTQFSNSALPSFQQLANPCNQDYNISNFDLLLGGQGIRSCNNNFDLPPPPLMQTQIPISQQFDHQFMQTQPVIPYNQDYGTSNFDLLLGGQGMRSCNNNFDLPPPHLMQTQTPISQQFDHQFMQIQPVIPYNQTPYFGNPPV